MGQSNSFGRILTIIIVLVLIVFAAAWLMNRKDHRTPEQKLDAAVSSGIAGVSSATSKLTDTGEKASSADSAIQSAGDNAGAALSKAGVAASSAVSVAGEKASVAMSETSADIKAAVDKQKQQNRAQARKSESASSSQKGD